MRLSYNNINYSFGNKNLPRKSLKNGWKLSIFISSPDVSPSVSEVQLNFGLDPRNVFICQFLKNKMSSKINQNISACLGSIFEDTNLNVVKYEVILSVFKEEQSHGTIG